METKTAIITGGSRGLGHEMALRLSERGVNIIFSYHSNKEAADETVAELKSNGVDAAAFQMDANDPESGQAFIESAAQYLEEQNGAKHFDYLINNAGTGIFNLVANSTFEQFDEMMNVHLKTVYFTTQTALPYLKDGGRIINISSGLTRFSFPGMTAYAIMKGAVEVFTRYLAKELGERKITANTIAPGAIATDFAGGSNKDEEKAGIIASVTALGRVGETTDVGGVVAFLCSEDAGWVNGQRIEVSGGMLV
jgi:NAD(P)-dependent dehydrogenase (short-subunit alcohol dehydrogenase family)